MLSLLNSNCDTVSPAWEPVSGKLQLHLALSRSTEYTFLVAFGYRHARWIRNRYTVLDLAAELGQLEAWEADVLRDL